MDDLLTTEVHCPYDTHSQGYSCYCNSNGHLYLGNMNVCNIMGGGQPTEYTTVGDFDEESMADTMETDCPWGTHSHDGFCYCDNNDHKIVNHVSQCRQGRFECPTNSYAYGLFCYCKDSGVITIDGENCVSGDADIVLLPGNEVGGVPYMEEDSVAAFEINENRFGIDTETVDIFMSLMFVTFFALTYMLIKRCCLKRSEEYIPLLTHVDDEI